MAESSSSERLIFTLALLGLTLLAAPFLAWELRWLVDAWQHDPYYQHGPLVLLASGIALLLRLKNRRLTLGHFESMATAGWIVATLICLLAGYKLKLHSVSVLGFLCLIKSYLKLWGGDPGWAFDFPLFFLICAIPIPFLPELTALLQVVVAHCAASILSTVGLPAMALGTLIELPHISFAISAGCSGVQSLIALLTLMIFITSLLREPVKIKSLLAGLTVPLAFLANLFRVIAVLLVGHWWGSEAALRMWHQAAGMIFYLFSLGGLGTLYFLLRRWSPRTST